MDIICRDVQLTPRSHHSQTSDLFPDNNDEDNTRPQDNDEDNTRPPDNEPFNNNNIPNDDNDDYNNVDEDEHINPSNDGLSLPNDHNSVKCMYYHKVYSIPTGNVKNLDYLHSLGVSDSYKDCAELCCRHGPRCQIGWLFSGKCYAVGCNSDHKKMCKPKTVDLDSILVIMKNDPSNYIYPSSSLVMSMLSSSSAIDSSHASNSASMTSSPSSSPFVAVPTFNPIISTEPPTSPSSSKLTPPTKSSNKHHKLLHNCEMLGWMDGWMDNYIIAYITQFHT